MKIKISQITIKDRFRKEYGDIDSLAESIDDIGMLQPIGVDSNYRLIFGERRIKACLALGMDSIDGVIIHIDEIIKGELAENEVRQDFTVSERVAILGAIERKKVGNPEFTNSQIFANSNEAAKQAGLGNKETARQATKAVADGIPEVVEKMDAEEISISGAATIATLSPEEQEDVVELPPKEAVKEAKRRAHVAHNSGVNEWYTPQEYIDAAREVMGGIDLDPASTALANETVHACRYFTGEDNGLNQEWTGRIWLNPPYAQPLINQFSEKLSASIEDIDAAIVLVNNATDTKWFQRMLSCCDAVCFITGRVKFLDPEGNPGAPLQGQAAIYFGADLESFKTSFSKFGTVLNHA